MGATGGGEVGGCIGEGDVSGELGVVVRRKVDSSKQIWRAM